MRIIKLGLSRPSPEYTLSRSALADISDIFPSIRRKGIEGVDSWLLELAQPDDDAKINKDLKIDHKGLYEGVIRLFMCDIVSVAFLPSGPHPRIVRFVKGLRMKEVLRAGGSEAVALRQELDRGLEELARGERFDRPHTIATLRRVEEQYLRDPR